MLCGPAGQMLGGRHRQAVEDPGELPASGRGRSDCVGSAATAWASRLKHADCDGEDVDG
jgi:hypothetical protein